MIISFDEIVLPSEININPTDGTLIVEADGESEETSYDSSEFSNKSPDNMTDEELTILLPGRSKCSIECKRKKLGYLRPQFKKYNFHKCI